MSDATVRPGGSAHPTRQQLDDLEALMQRMLALPVNQADDEPPAEFPVPTPEARVPVPDVVEPVRVEESAWPSVAPAVETVVSEPPPRLVAKPQAAIAVKAPAVLGQVRRHWLRRIAPILWVNRSFDNWTGQLGRPGRWLRSRQGRALLGALGLLFIAASIAWMILAFVGWTW